MLMSKSFKITVILLLAVGLVHFVKANLERLVWSNTAEINIGDIVEKPEVVTRPEDVYAMNRTEVFPDLSTSGFKADTDQADPGDVIRYTANIINTGNVDATDIDVFIELDNSFELLDDIRFSDCGDEHRTEMGYEMELSNVTVRKDNNCRITLEVKMGNHDAVSALYISPAAEGGVEIGPIYANTVATGKSEVIPEPMPEPDPVAGPDEGIDEKIPEEIPAEIVPEPDW